MSAATHRCKVCKALWALIPPFHPGHCGPKGCPACLYGGWSLVKPAPGMDWNIPSCGPCCDNPPAEVFLANLELLTSPTEIF